MPDYFPAFLDLRGRRCLVVGGGTVAERKVRDLLACATDVTVVSPAVTATLAQLAAAGTIVHRRRRFRASDARGIALVVTATDDADVDRVVVRAARRAHALVNVVDRADLCDFIVPSVLRRGELQIAVSTGGRSPALAREIRRRLEPAFGPEYAELVERAGLLRAQARAAAITRDERLLAGMLAVAHVFEGREDSMIETSGAVRTLTSTLSTLVDHLVTERPGQAYGDIQMMVERAVFGRALEITRGNQLQAARLLGVNRNTLRKYCRRLSLIPVRAPRAVAV